MFNQVNGPKRDTSLVIGMLISIGIVCIAALLVIGSITQNSDTDTIFPIKRSADKNKLPNISTQLSRQSELKTFSSYEDLSNYLESSASVQNYYAGNLRTFAMDSMAEGMPMAINESAKADIGGGGGDFSQTNIQVAGVDEADIIKTDGKYIYAVSEGNIFIVNASGPNTAVTSVIELDDRPQNIYINGNKLIVFGNNYSLFSNSKIADILPRSQYTFLHVYDISNKTNPELVKKLDFEGYYANSRMIGDYLYFITNHWPHDFSIQPIPRLLENDSVICQSEIPNGTTCPEVHYFNIPYPSQQMTTVSAINIGDLDQAVTRSIYILESSQNIYVSTNALYLTTVKYLNEFQLTTEVLQLAVENNLSDKIKDKINKIERVDSDILSDNEKIQKIHKLIQSHILALSQTEQEALEEKVQDMLKHRYEEIKNELEKTIIHKIAIDKDDIRTVATGEVTGTVLNQFSMDEHNGFFRIATTNNQRWFPWIDGEAQQSYNNLYILDENLQPAGSITNIAPDERIFSVRFMQDRAYMVTFEQVDPLFVIDTSDPYNPSILGELKIPGFSNYLHPYDENTIIGIGQSTRVDEFDRVRTEGVKLSLFDVSDVTNPREIDNYIVDEQSSTPVQHDHKAFLFSKDKNLLVLPINTWTSKLNFNGVLVFDITIDGFTRVGAIEHTDVNLPQARYQNQIQRSLYIDNNLYTLSTAELKVNELGTLDDISFVSLFREDNKYNPGYPEPVFFDDDVMIMELDATEDTMMEINEIMVEEILGLPL